MKRFANSSTKPMSTRLRFLIVTLAVLSGTTLAIYEFNATLHAATESASSTADSESTAAATATTSGSSESSPTAAVQNKDSNSKALAECVATLDKVRKKLEQVDDYKATFMIRERVDGELTDKQRVALQVRHEPFSVRMKWIDEGREVVFIKGQNDDQLVVRPGGLASLVGTLELDPKGETAMAKSRYPITEAGMLALVKKLLNYQKPLLHNTVGVECVRSKEQCEGQDCDCFVVTYRDAKICDGYAKTTLHVDRKSGLLVSIKNDCFDPKSDSGTNFVEHYVFKNVRPDVGFTDDDFTLAQTGLAGRLRTAVAQKNAIR